MRYSSAKNMQKRELLQALADEKTGDDVESPIQVTNDALLSVTSNLRRLSQSMVAPYVPTRESITRRIHYF